MLRRPLLFLLLGFSSQPAIAQNERHFIFHYAFTVKNVSHGERMLVWIPLAHIYGSVVTDEMEKAGSRVVELAFRPINMICK